MAIKSQSVWYQVKPLNSIGLLTEIVWFLISFPIGPNIEILE